MTTHIRFLTYAGWRSVRHQFARITMWATLTAKSL